MQVKIAIKRVAGADPAIALPSAASAGAAGHDLRAQLPDGAVTLPAGGRAMIPTGIAVAIPQGWEIQLRPRSGLAARYGVTLTNSPGTIDSDYRGEIKVLMVNLGDAPLRIEHGDRIAQMIAAPVPQILWEEVSDLPATSRGDGGFGSTGRG